MTSIVGKFSVPATRDELEKKADKDHRHEITDVRLLDDTLNQVGEDIDQLESRNLVGHGFPEGKVTAPVGSVYTDVDATAGAVRWIKTAGTGTTGWKVEYGDTGWRDVTSLSDYVESGSIYIVREGSRVTMQFDQVVVKDMSTWVLFMNLPTGFRPPRNDHRQITVSNLTTVRDVYFQIYAAYGIRITNGENGTSWRFVIEWRTDQPWPATRPGIPAPA